MFIPQLDLLEKIVNENDIKALETLLKPNNRVQNRKNVFKSALMLSAHNLKHLLKIDSTMSDCVILNLEDGVAKEKKPLALRLCAYFLSKIAQSSKKLVVRVNALDEGGLEEIAFLNAYKPDAFRIPKVRSVEDVKKALSVMDRGIELHLSIETKEGFSNLKSLQYEGRVKAVYLGVLDLFADLDLDQGLLKPENPTLHYLLAEFLIGSKTIGAHAVSFVYQDYKNFTEFSRWLELEKMMGFSAKGCLSPAQANEVMAYFETQDKERERARYIIELFEDMKAKGVTGFSDNKYGFIDEPIYKGALSLLKDEKK